MLALTLWPEWTWATMHLDKDLENRDWAPPDEVVGQYVAIHGGAHIGGRAAKAARLEGLEMVCGSAEIAGWVLDEVVSEADGRVRIHARRPEAKVGEPTFIVPGAILGVRRLLRVVHESDAGDEHVRSPWFVGKYGWVWGERKILAQPIRCLGRQKLWTVPLPLRERIEADFPDVAMPRTAPEVVNRHWYEAGLPRPNIYIGRGSPLGNPFTLREHGSEALSKFRAHLWQKIRAGDSVVMRELDRITADHHLVCSCKPGPCHGDVIVKAWRWLQSQKEQASS